MKKTIKRAVRRVKSAARKASNYIKEGDKKRGDALRAKQEKWTRDYLNMVPPEKREAFIKQQSLTYKEWKANKNK
jgi:hypothetical protein